MSNDITERSVAADISAEFNKWFDQGGYPFDKATVEDHAGTGYPDIILWEDYTAKKAFASWELKPPGKQEDLSKLPAKAQALHVSYVVVWNFQQGTLYKFSATGEMDAQKSYPMPLLNNLEEWRIVPKRQQVLQQAEKILNDLASLKSEGSIRPFVPDKIYFINVLRDAVSKLEPPLEQHLLTKKSSRAWATKLNQWVVGQGIPTGTENLDVLIAQQWAYAIALRILFYMTVRRNFENLPDLKPVPNSAQSTTSLITQAFSQAQAVDWQAVFESDIFDEIGLPDAANTILTDLLSSFHRYDFGSLKEDVIGEILEGLIPPEERHKLGQYFTREDLVDFIVGFVANNSDAYYLDPTCGSGTFLNRLYSRLHWLSQYRANHSDLLQRIWGVDIAKFPAELATINLFRQNVRDTTNFPRVLSLDFFELHNGASFPFPPPHTNTPNYTKIQVPVPRFHGIVGNLPYIRQELIEKQIEGYKRTITLAVAHEWFWQDRELFAVNIPVEKEIAAVEKKGEAKRSEWLEIQIQDGKIDLRLSGQADIYAYLLIHAASFLENGARIGIVTSNSWLDVSYGLEVKRFLMRHFKIVAVVASWAEPWFQDAAVNTVFAVIERCDDASARAANITRFVKIKRPLSELLPQDLLLKENDRWRKVDALVTKVEAADAEAIPWEERAKGVTTISGIKTIEDNDFRIRLVSQVELQRETETQGEQSKWVKYLRAPKVYFDLLEHAVNRLVPLTTLATVRRGYTTGINDFFFLELVGAGKRADTSRVRNGRNEEFEIEEACLHPIITSMKETDGIVVLQSHLDNRLFYPPLSEKSLGQKNLKDELLKNHWPGARAYVEWGEKQRTGSDRQSKTKQVLFPQVPSVKGRKAWWLLSDSQHADFLMNRFIDKRFFIPMIGDFLVGDTFFTGTFKDSQNGEIVMALLNSSVYLLEMEVNGRVNLGDGLLTFYGPDIKSTLIPSPASFSSPSRKKIVAAFEKLKARAIKSIDQEVKEKDRQALDHAVLEGIGLDADAYLPAIYQGLVEMVAERLTLPKMRRRQQKQTQSVSLEQVKTQLRKEILPNGPKPIESFVPAKSRLMNVSVTARPVTWQQFFDEFTLRDIVNNEVGKLLGHEQQALYVIYAANENQYTFAVPLDVTIASKAIQKYEAHLRDIGAKLINRALEATRDQQQSERVVREILESFDLSGNAIEKAMEM